MNVAACLYLYAPVLPMLALCASMRRMRPVSVSHSAISCLRVLGTKSLSREPTTECRDTSRQRWRRSSIRATWTAIFWTQVVKRPPTPSWSYYTTHSIRHQLAAQEGLCYAQGVRLWPSASVGHWTDASLEAGGTGRFRHLASVCRGPIDQRKHLPQGLDCVIWMRLPLPQTTKRHREPNGFNIIWQSLHLL